MGKNRINKIIKISYSDYKKRLTIDHCVENTIIYLRKEYLERNIKKLLLIKENNIPYKIFDVNHPIFGELFMIEINSKLNEPYLKLY